ncbi:MAG: pilus assembly protein TadG-related protein, partial [Acidimicrobiales bacterium]
MRPTTHSQLSTRRHRRGERGYVLGLIGLLIVPMVGFVALATDVGAWYGEATSVQRAADAAALAGVVWMPDTTKATEVALAVAERNGYDDDDADIEVIVEPVPGNEEQLRVIIRNLDPPIFFAGAFLDDFSISRQAIAEYVLPVPLGSPRNHLGTGDLLSSNEEGFWLAINGFCAPMEQGDHRAARFAGNWSNGGSGNDRICPTGAAGVSAPVGPGPNSGGSSGNTYWEDN